MPLVSVIIPVFNIAEYLPRSLESLTAQTFGDFEILCVDDGSADGSAEVVLEYREGDGRICLLKQAHAGVSAARNLGIRHAKGKYILFFDGDDWAERDMLKALVAAAEETRSDMVICSANVQCDDRDRATCRRLASLEKNLTVPEMVWEATEDPGCTWDALELPGAWPFVWNKLIRTGLIRENDIRFSEQLQLGEDGLFLQVLFQYVRRIRFINLPLYNYRYQRKASATVRLSQEQGIRFSQHVGIFRNLCDELAGRNLLEGNLVKVLPWMVDFLYNDFVKLPAQLQPVASGNLRSILSEHGLLQARDGLDRTQERRLGILRGTISAPSGAGRVYRILRTKIENRVRRLFSR